MTLMTDAGRADAVVLLIRMVPYVTQKFLVVVFNEDAHANGSSPLT